MRFIGDPGSFAQGQRGEFADLAVHDEFADSQRDAHLLTNGVQQLRDLQ